MTFATHKKETHPILASNGPPEDNTRLRLQSKRKQLREVDMSHVQGSDTSDEVNKDLKDVHEIDTHPILASKLRRRSGLRHCSAFIPYATGARQVCYESGAKQSFKTIRQRNECLSKIESEVTAYELHTHTILASDGLRQKAAIHRAISASILRANRAREARDEPLQGRLFRIPSRSTITTKGTDEWLSKYESHCLATTQNANSALSLDLITKPEIAKHELKERQEQEVTPVCYSRQPKRESGQDHA
ncbi:hypothetical protein BJ508DRAFT_304976 [Ascobolus immersus RN42]|uniref:Uncharacterized protein n=1 Tax=Ascobolus immersus RN42 TaxID=1160509 RepID=A0A3N4IAY0_ASCIM|nr:hypothetical protein BJ508DRAFT_304976 [Ascobolus immersus RN42]